MLSFDITDRNIKIIRGSEKKGKIKIISSANIDIAEGTIVNGYIKEIPQMASIISAALKSNKMNDKEAVISISSNLIVFKELHIPKAKPAQFKTMVQNQMQQTISITDEHCISYTIAGDILNNDTEYSKVLATACPRIIIDCYKRVFSMLSISLKSAAVSCNSISKIVLADSNFTDKMPLLVVQIDKNFININLFEDGQLAFSRFASVSEDDYDDKEDYVFQAVNENIFRMLQFQRSRSSLPIENVIFYGDNSEFIRLKETLEQMDINSSVLDVPSCIIGSENLEFLSYANAIGTMFKSQKEVESINLLDVDTGTTNQVDVPGSALFLQIGTAFGIGALIVLAVFSILSINNKNLQVEIADIDNNISSEQAKLAKIDTNSQVVENFDDYIKKAQLAKTGFDSNPVLRTKVFSQIDACLSGAAIKGLSYSNGQLTLQCFAGEYYIPSLFVQNLYQKKNNIAAIGYSGYTNAPETSIIPETGQSQAPGYSFSVLLQLNGESDLTGSTKEKQESGAAE